MNYYLIIISLHKANSKTANWLITISEMGPCLLSRSPHFSPCLAFKKWLLICVHPGILPSRRAVWEQKQSSLLSAQSNFLSRSQYYCCSSRRHCFESLTSWAGSFSRRRAGETQCLVAQALLISRRPLLDRMSYSSASSKFHSLGKLLCSSAWGGPSEKFIRSVSAFVRWPSLGLCTRLCDNTHYPWTPSADRIGSSSWPSLELL